MTTLDHTHVYSPPSREGAATLVLLHGTGGNEHDLMPIARMLDPDAGVLGVRGNVLENGMPRFFKRLAVGLLDEDDLKVRAASLAEFVLAAAEQYDFRSDSAVAVGFSNGANIAAGVIWHHPQLFRHAILLRAMSPYREELPIPRDPGTTSVFIGAGRGDPYAPIAEVDLLSRRLTDAGVDVKVEWQEGGHSLVQGDVLAAAAWLREQGY